MSRGITSSAGRFADTLLTHKEVSEVFGKCTGSVASSRLVLEGDLSQDFVLYRFCTTSVREVSLFVDIATED